MPAAARDRLRRSRDERFARQQALEAAHSPVGLAALREERRDAADAGRLRLAPDRADLLEALRRVRGRDRRVGIEGDPGGRAGELAVGRDVLALAEEPLVERVLERAHPALLARPEAGGER